MCDCIKQVKQTVEEHFKKTLQPNEEYGYTEMGTAALMFKEGGKRTTVETVSYVNVNYIVNTKTGKRQNKEKVFNMSHKYCPFCGEKYSE
jgi:hypothetical protein